MEAYKKGVFDYIKEDYDQLSQKRIPRKYFSGGVLMSAGDLEQANSSVVKDSRRSYKVKVKVDPEGEDERFSRARRNFFKDVGGGIKKVAVGAAAGVMLKPRFTAAYPLSMRDVETVLKNSYEDYTIAAAGRMGASGDERAIKPLKTLLLDYSPNIRKAAIDALIQLGQKDQVIEFYEQVFVEFNGRSVGHLEDAAYEWSKLKGKNWRDAFKDLLLNGQIKHQIAAKFMMEFLEERIQKYINNLEGPYPSRDSVTAMRLWKEESAVLPLIKAHRTSDDENLRRTIISALWEISDLSERDLYLLIHERDILLGLKVAFGTAAVVGAIVGYYRWSWNSVGGLLRHLKNRSPENRKAARDKLRKKGAATYQLVEGNLRALWSEQVDVVLDAVEELGALGDSSAIVPLLQKLTHPSSRVRAAASKAVTAVGASKKQRVDVYIKALESQDKGIILDAVKALEELEDKDAVEPLAKKLNNIDPKVRKAVVEALGKLGDKGAVQPLLGMLNDRDEGCEESCY